MVEEEIISLIVMGFGLLIAIVCYIMFRGTSKDLADLERLRYECQKEIDKTDEQNKDW